MVKKRTAKQAMRLLTRKRSPKTRVYDTGTKSRKESTRMVADPEQASELLGISRSTVIRLIVDGQLAAICLRSGRRKKVWRIRREVLEKWVLNKERQGTKPAKPSLNGQAEAKDLT